MKPCCFYTFRTHQRRRTKYIYLYHLYILYSKGTSLTCAVHGQYHVTKSNTDKAYHITMFHSTTSGASGVCLPDNGSEGLGRVKEGIKYCLDLLMHKLCRNQMNLKCLGDLVIDVMFHWQLAGEVTSLCGRINCVVYNKNCWKLNLICRRQEKKRYMS